MLKSYMMMSPVDVTNDSLHFGYGIIGSARSASVSRIRLGSDTDQCGHKNIPATCSHCTGSPSELLPVLASWRACSGILANRQACFTRYVTMSRRFVPNYTPSPPHAITGK